MPQQILLVEDDPRLYEFLKRGLRAEGYAVLHAKNGDEAIAMARQLWNASKTTGEAAVIVLDVMLPGQNGLDICRVLRAAGVALPILMLTALSDVEDRVRGLRAGADDYLGKPFEFEELLARIEAMFRRQGKSSSPASGSIELGRLRLDVERAAVFVDERRIDLSARELSLLKLLMASPGRVFSRERILSAVWDANTDPLTNIVEVYVGRLRKKLIGAAGSAPIETVRGLGYRFAEPASDDPQLR
ncbi:response regulator transcription factor [Bosea thiooxidans]